MNEVVEILKRIENKLEEMDKRLKRIEGKLLNDLGSREDYFDFDNFPSSFRSTIISSERLGDLNLPLDPYIDCISFRIELHRNHILSTFKAMITTSPLHGSRRIYPQEANLPYLTSIVSSGYLSTSSTCSSVIPLSSIFFLAWVLFDRF